MIPTARYPPRMATITGAHMIVYSANGDADRTFLRDVRFIDDSRVNVSTATALGMPAHLARHPAEARSVLVDYGVVL